MTVLSLVTQSCLGDDIGFHKDDYGDDDDDGNAGAVAGDGTCKDTHSSFGDEAGVLTISIYLECALVGA